MREGGIERGIISADEEREGSRGITGKGKGKRDFIFRIANAISKASANLTLCRRHAIHH